MKIGIVGSRDYTDYKAFKAKLDELFVEFEGVTHIVSGGAKGVDTMAEKYATEYDFEKLIFPANWDLYGKSAGYLRNIDIVKNSDVVIAFWVNKSKGTKHSIDLAKQMEKQLIIIEITK